MCQIADWVVFTLLAACSVIDWRRKTIPYVLLLALGIVVVAFAFFCNGVSVKMRVGGVLIGVLFLLISKMSREAIGYGDSFLILFLGIHMGSFEALGVLFVAALLAAVVSLFFLWKCHWKRQATLPFVPFLTISYLGAILL